jgi:hypothetical protein
VPDGSLLSKGLFAADFMSRWDLRRGARFAIVWFLNGPLTDFVWSNAGLGTEACSGACKAGYFCPAGSTSANKNSCGNATYYCPSGSSRRQLLTPGFYTISEDQNSDAGFPPNGPSTISTRTAQVPCDPGYYCPPDTGVRIPCPAGTYGRQSELTTVGCSAPCPLGHYCPLASVEPTKCPAGTYGASLGLM